MLLLALFAAPLALQARAQEQAAGRDALLAEQQRLFAQLQARPDDLDAMFAYAVVSLRLGDFEQAIATLERMLIYRDDLPRVKLELGSAYFQLGSYEVARFYFDEVLDADPPADVRARVEQFLAEIGRRKKKSAFAGQATFGIVYSSNANLGPADREVDVFGVDALLDPDFVEEDDFGVRATLSLGHAYDLGRPNDDAWVTGATFAALRYFSESAGNIEALFVKTGPRLALTQEARGPTIRPFADGSYVRSADDFLYASWGGGTELGYPLGEATSLFATLGARYRDYTSEQNESDSLDFYGELGAQHWIEGGWRLNASAFGVLEDAREDFVANYELGGRLGAAYTYAPGSLGDERNPWTLSAFAQLSRRWFDEPDPAVDPGRTRRDLDARLGVSHLFRLKDGWGLSLEASYFNRDSNIRNFDLDNFEVGAFVTKSF